MACTEKHTKYQPTDAEWKCPQCDGNNDVFWIEENIGSEDCELLHDEDVAVCIKCKIEITGKAFAARLQKLHSLVTCPCCKGTGLVKKDSTVVKEV